MQFTYRSYPCWCAADDDQPLLKRDCYGNDLPSVICRNCGTVRIDPYISPQDGETYYTEIYPEAYFEQGQSLEKRYEQIKTVSRATLFASFVDDMKSERGRPLRILDYGGATGGRLDIFKEEHQVHVYDLNPKRVEFALSRGYGAHTPQMIYDMVYSCHTMEHWIDLKPNTDAFLGGLDKQGGAVVVELPFLDRIIGGVRLNGLQDEIYFPHKWCFFVDSFRFFMAERGFYCIDTDYCFYTIFKHDEARAMEDKKILEKDILGKNLQKIEEMPSSGFSASVHLLARNVMKKISPLLGK